MASWVLGYTTISESLSSRKKKEPWKEPKVKVVALLEHLPQEQDWDQFPEHGMNEQMNE